MSGISALTSLLSSTAIALLGLSLVTDPALTRPQATASFPAAPPITISQRFVPARRGQAPPSAGGATRGDSCLPKNKQLISLIPQNQVGLTYSTNPTFYWYVPESPAKTAQFLILSDDRTEVFYETTLTLPKRSGIISVTLPTAAPPLTVGKQYQWFLVLGCDAIDQSANPSVEGWVERITPDAALAKRLQKASPKERVQIYASNGIWHEAITTLAQLRQANPTDTLTIAGWQELLQSVSLGQVATEPLLNATLSQN